jgi:hypothetical protein
MSIKNEALKRYADKLIEEFNYKIGKRNTSFDGDTYRFATILDSKIMQNLVYENQIKFDKYIIKNLKLIDGYYVYYDKLEYTQYANSPIEIAVTIKRR